MFDSLYVCKIWKVNNPYVLENWNIKKILGLNYVFLFSFFSKKKFETYSFFIVTSALVS